MRTRKIPSYIKPRRVRTIGGIPLTNKSPRLLSVQVCVYAKYKLTNNKKRNSHRKRKRPSTKLYDSYFSFSESSVMAFDRENGVKKGSKAVYQITGLNLEGIAGLGMARDHLRKIYAKEEDISLPL